MLIKRGWARYVRVVVILPLLISLAAPIFPGLTKDAKAAAFNIKSGYYVGTGASLSISGIGFQPQLIIIKANVSTAITQLKTKDMSTNVVASASASADNVGVTIDPDGFSLGTSVNSNALGAVFHYEAFAGSDCTSTGTFCVGTYSGTGVASRAITTGFQPGLVMAKSNKAVASHFMTASMPTGRTEFTTSTAANTTGAYINSLTSSGFTVGSTDNASGSNFYYIAFKSDPTIMAEGSYIGDGLDNRNITGLGFSPNFIFVKNSSSVTANNRRSLFATPESYGDMAHYFADGVTPPTNMIQGLSAGSFQVGSGVNTNESGSTTYWFALGGNQTANAGSGTYTMKTGVYTGTGSALSITGAGFRPNLVIIKASTANNAVFRTSLMVGNNSSVLNGSLSDYSGGITSIDSDGFTLGTEAGSNTLGTTYYWQAFGNAWNPYTNSGAADFAIGVYQGTAEDNRNIGGLPFAPSLLTVKRNGSSPGMFRTSEHSGDLTSRFTNLADASNLIQSLGPSSFQVGNAADVDSSGSLYRWFAFKSGANLSVGTYTGNGLADKAVDTVGFQPDLVWVRNANANYSVMRSSNITGDSTQYMANLANATNRIKSITSTGFTVGNTAEVNSNTVAYRFVAWRVPPTGSLGVNVVDSTGSTVSSPTFSLSSQPFPFNCLENSGNFLGTSSQKIRITNSTGSPGWSLSVAATSGTTSYWQNGGGTQTYDYNDPSGFGCADGADADSRAGIMTIDPSVSDLDAQSGCSSSNITKGSISNFSEGLRDSLTLLSASTSAETDCYWDTYNIGLAQTLPAEQAADSYNINLTITVVAF